jgi:hypothetical protein
MATPIRLKRSSVPNKRPSLSDLQLGELAVNTYDGALYTKRERAGFGTEIALIGFAGLSDFPVVTNILYVTKDGSDANDGTKLGAAKATIKAAVGVAEAGTVIKVSAGTYVEDNPIKVPDQVSIVGDSLREVTVTPANQGDLFHLGNGNYMWNMSFVGPENPGAIFAFDPDRIVYNNQSPYIQNCTNFIPGSIGMKVDGSLALGPRKSMVLDSYTQYNQGGIGVSITNEGYAQLVSLFTICPDIAVYCGGGSACDLTNSNASFGNYGLVADGIGTKKFTGIVTVASPTNADTFTLDLNTPSLNIVNAYYDNATGLLTAYTNQPHRFSVGMGITLSGIGFTCSYDGGITTVSYPSGNYGYVFEAKTVAPGRYVDSYNLIQANKREIQDKSLAAISLNHPDFYFPGDSQTNARSRYYDSYRLIQKNKDVIVGIAWTNTYNVYPGISTTMLKCKRDLGYFVDAISTDVFTGGNKYAREFTLQYFNAGSPIANGLVGVETASVYAFSQARDLMKSAITNTLVGAAYSDLTITADYLTGFNTSPYSCADVQSNIDNLVGIVTTVIGVGNSSGLPSENLGTFTTGGSKCFRDIGYIIDSVSKDVRDYTSENSISATKYYFDINGNAISNGLVGEEAETITAFTAARDYMKHAITNQLNNKNLTIVADPVTGFNTDPTSCADVRSFIDNLVGIITTRISAGNITGVNQLPAVSAASTVFSLNVGISTISHTYASGGTASINITRPYDGQVIYFNDLFYSVNKVIVSAGGTGYTSTPTVTIDAPLTSWGVQATAVPEVTNGRVTAIQIISSGRGYTSIPRITIGSPNSGINTATATIELLPTYHSIISSTPISSGICTITINENIPYAVGVNTNVFFFKQSRVLASGHSFEYIGSGTKIDSSLPSQGGVAIPDNETDARNGGLVVYTSTDQSGNFRIGEGVAINQQTGTISGATYSKSLFSTLTPFILALGGE